jgi:hypothetical protein
MKIRKKRKDGVIQTYHVGNSRKIKLPIKRTLYPNINYSISKIKEKIIYINKKEIKRLFNFVGEGIDEIEFTSFYNHQTKVYTNECTITFFEDAYGHINFEDLKKAEIILKKLKGRNGVEDYIIKNNKIIIIFEDEYELDY